MIRKLIRFPRNLVIAWHWAAALGLDADEKYEDSLRVLEKINQAKGLKIEINMLRAHCYLKLQNYDDCILLGKNLLSDIRHSKGLSKDEKRYCLLYTLWLMGIAQPKASTYLRTPNYGLYEKHFSQLKLDNISRSWKENFPLRIHPDWPENE